ncbi:hypothetical protein [Streptomyces sp. NPDC060022]|uniref:hypothetical protein n=1 Tax=Streptomyces sp. NPDC060022 TaxID=3347039 RepID=UPI0036C3BD6E
MAPGPSSRSAGGGRGRALLAEATQKTDAHFRRGGWQGRRPTESTQSAENPRGGLIESPKPGEIIYTDTIDVLTRRWNHRDAHRTRVAEDSTHVAFVLETLHATRDGHLLKTAVSYSIYLIRFVEGEVVALDIERFRQATAPYVWRAARRKASPSFARRTGARRISTTHFVAKRGCHV